VHTPSNLVVENGKTRRRKKINKNPRAMWQSWEHKLHFCALALTWQWKEFIFLKGQGSRRKEEGSWKRGYRFRTVVKDWAGVGAIIHGNIIDVRLNAYAKQYVPRRNGAAGGSYGGGGSSGRSWILTYVCIYIRLCWNKNEMGNIRASHA
jgi:hypothetical protein